MSSVLARPLRACTYYRTSYVLLFGAPVDPRLVHAFDRETTAFLKAATLFDPPIEPVEIPYDGTTLPGYFYRVDVSGRPRPTLIATNGYDATVHQMHFGHAVAAVRRGYNCLLFDGPGQGRVLYKQSLPLRPDWEHVVTPVVDYAVSRPEVDPTRIALIGWSFGGYLAPRAASAEPRLAACIADPGLWDLLEALKASAPLPPEVRDHLADVDPAVLQPLFAWMAEEPALHWAFIQRGLWVHGLESLFDYIRVAPAYSLASHVAQIRCPTLVTWAEREPLAQFAGRLYDALTCPKALLRFTHAEGAGDHCEAMARTLFHQRAFDWLDEVLHGAAAARV